MNEGTTISYCNEVTRAIDAQPIIAPQYGVMGNPPKYDPPPQGPKSRKSKKRGYLRSRKPSASQLVRRQRTRDLKICISILEMELQLIESGQLEVGAKAKKAMETRLQLMRDEKTRRDLRDLASGKMTPPRSFYAIGARLKAA